jgi:hypothetical protein
VVLGEKLFWINGFNGDLLRLMTSRSDPYEQLMRTAGTQSNVNKDSKKNDGILSKAIDLVCTKQSIQNPN